MSRRRNRTRFDGPQSFQAAQTTPALPALSTPVQIDPSKFEIRDMRLFARMPEIAESEAAAQAALPQIVDMLERVIVGGIAGRKVTELWPLVAERATREAGQQ